MNKMNDWSFYNGFSSLEDEKPEITDRTDSCKPVFKLSKCMIQPSKRIETCNKVENIRREIDDLNMKIMKLLNVRSMMLAQVDDHIGEICGSEYFLGYKWGTVRNEWYSKNFESDIIRNCVSNIRDIFFDKSDVKFKEFICDEVTFDNNWDDSIGFTFSKKDFRNKFTITIPNSTQKRYLGRENGEFSENLCAGEMRVLIDTGVWSSLTLFSSLSIIKMKAFVKNLIENYEAVITEYEAKQMSHQKSEKWYNSGCENSFFQSTQDDISNMIRYKLINPEDVEVKEIEPKDHIPLEAMMKDSTYF